MTSFIFNNKKKTSLFFDKQSKKTNNFPVAMFSLEKQSV